ncbi:MAG: hypothetical protein IJ343_04415 [Clostridia bacterium]|nr:hypothetical protein [Clostridia bacterium]
MGKKINHRATQAQNQQAIARRRQAEEARKKEWWDMHFKHVLIAVIAAVVLLIAGIVAYNLYTDSLLPARIGNLNDIQEDWLVIDTDNTVRKRYHHPASFTVPEGYTKSDFTTRSDGVQRDFHCNAASEDQLVESFFISAYSELTAEEYIERVIANAPNALSDENMKVANAEPLKGVVAGKDASYLYMTYSRDENTAYSCLFVAYDAPRDVVVSSVLSSRDSAPDAVPSADALLAEAETLLAGLTIVE